MVVWSALPFIGGMFAMRAGSAVPSMIQHGGSLRQGISHFATSPIIQGGQFGVGYTGGAYSGYGISNTWDPLGVHKPKYKQVKGNLGLAYGYYGRRYGRYRRFRRYRGYRSRRYYRRGYY